MPLRSAVLLICSRQPSIYHGGDCIVKTSYIIQHHNMDAHMHRHSNIALQCYIQLHCMLNYCTYTLFTDYALILYSMIVMTWVYIPSSVLTLWPVAYPTILSTGSYLMPRICSAIDFTVRCLVSFYTALNSLQTNTTRYSTSFSILSNMADTSR